MKQEKRLLAGLVGLAMTASGGLSVARAA